MRAAFGIGRLAAWVLAVLVLLGPELLAQRRPRIRVTDIEIRELDTPLYDERTHPRAKSEREWVQIFVEYETAGGEDGWADEVVLEFAVIINPPGEKPILLKQKVTYADVQEGDHYAAVYIRPRFILRHYGDDNVSSSDIAVHVRSYANGRRGGTETEARVRLPDDWWDLRPPTVDLIDGELLIRTKTPFAPLDWDLYEYIKEQ